jgi:hypothetical protein
MASRRRAVVVGQNSVVTRGLTAAFAGQPDRPFEARIRPAMQWSGNGPGDAGTIGIGRDEVLVFAASGA